MSDRVQNRVPLRVQVEIDVTDILYIVFGSGVSAFLYWIHADIHVGAGSIAGCEPCLKFGVCYSFGLCDPLDRLAGSTIPSQDRGVVGGFEELPNVFRSGERARCESGVAAHGCSCLARNTEP